MTIGFFDSGIGGLTVLYEALKLLPNAKYIYYADCKNVPYGNKTKHEVQDLVLKAVEFLNTVGINALVVACNTATAVAIKELREKYSFPVIGMEPAVKPAVTNRISKRVLVIATEMTLREEKFQNLVQELDREDIVDYIPFQKLVSFAENFEFASKELEEYLENQFKNIEVNRYETLVLGCTHFPYFKKHLAKHILEGTRIIDGNVGTIKNLIKQLPPFSSENQSIRYFESGIEVPAEKFEKYLRYYKSCND